MLPVPKCYQELPRKKIVNFKDAINRHFEGMKILKIPHKVISKYREGGRTVGSGRVVTIIE